MRISLLIKTLQPDQSNPKLVCPKEMFFQQKLLEKAYFIVKMIGPVIVWPASSDFWKQFILLQRMLLTTSLHSGLQALCFTGKLKYYSFIIDRFEGLIDREWLRGGHPFTERCIKVGVSPVRYKGQGAVFLLFLDCVWQVSVENKNHETIPSRFFPEQETKKSYVFCHLSLVHKVLTAFSESPKPLSENDPVNCVHCDDHLFIFISFPQFIYDLFHISFRVVTKISSCPVNTTSRR